MEAGLTPFRVGNRLSANGQLFFVPYFSGGFNTSKGFDGSLWINTKYLGNKIGKAAPLPVPRPTPTPAPNPSPGCMSGAMKQVMSLFKK